jgi:haloacetate dehalogenase
MADSALTFPGFSPLTVPAPRATLYGQTGGTGPPVVLLHGFPETHLMWRSVAPLLALQFTVYAFDLPGYGDSTCPADLPEHAAMAKRALADLVVAAMATLGHERFAMVGHDRGGRVAYRCALDHPRQVSRLAVLDVIPTATAWAQADARMMLAFWPFSLLAQPAPLPETLLTAAPAAIVDSALREWGTDPAAFPPAHREAYISALGDPTHAHTICEEYRAAAGIDRAHDDADATASRRIICPLLALWAEGGGLDQWYAGQGGPLGIWRRWAHDVQGEAMPGGHFFPERFPERTADRLARFLTGGEPAAATLEAAASRP